MESVSNIANSMPSTHPFYPPELKVAGYVANDWDVPTLLVVFALCWVVVLGTTSVVVGKVNPDLRGWDRALVLWFVLSKPHREGKYWV